MINKPQPEQWFMHVKELVYVNLKELVKLMYLPPICEVSSNFEGNDNRT